MKLSEEQLEEIVCELLKKQCGEEVPKDKELLASGLLGSFQLFDLVCDLEETFDIQFRQADIKEVSRFSSVNAILDMIKKYTV